MSGFKVKHSLDYLDEGEEIELTLADTSVLTESSETLINSHLEELQRAKTNQKIKQIAKSKGITHSYDDIEPQNILSKYDEPNEEKEGFELDESGNFVSKIKDEIKVEGNVSLNVKKNIAKEFYEFKVPKKRVRAIDFLEGSRTERQEKFLMNRKIAKIRSTDEDEDFDLEKSLQVSLRKKMSRGDVNLNETPITQEGEEYTDTTQFLNSVQPVQNTTQFSLRDTRDGTVSISNVTLPTERLKGSASVQPMLIKTPEATNNPPSNAEMALDPEPKIDRGLAGCLALLRERNELNKNFYFGRNNDKVSSETEYRDSKGRLLTLKQAYREQSNAFHNKYSGKNKQKKLEDRDKLQIKQEKINSSRGSSTFQATKSIMSKKETPYVIIPNKK